MSHRLLREGGGQVDRLHHRSGLRVRSLTDVHRARRKARLAKHQRPRWATNSRRSERVMTPTMASPSKIINAGSPRSSASNASSIGAAAEILANGASMAVETGVETTAGSR